MEGEQKQEIPLNSNIDTETSSQLVSVNEPTLSYNPQEYQGEVLPSSLRYEHDGWAEGMYVHEFPIKDGNMYCHTTHIETGEECDIAKVPVNSEYTCVKQQWDSSMETEYFWYVDPTHILQLTKHEFILLENNGTLHHWNGNNFDVVWRKPRTDILSSQDYKFFCTSSRDGSTVRFVVIQYGTNTRFYIRLYDPMTLNQISNTAVLIQHVDLGSPLRNTANVLYTYHHVDANNLVSQSKWSSTSVNGYLLIGLQYTKGLAQWTLQMDDSGIVRKITGYGCVGVDGLLTGGEIPNNYCDGNGIVDGFTVHHIRDLDQMHNGSGTNIGGEFNHNWVIGTESQHWFVQKTVSGIVSHLVWNGSGFNPVSITLNNNYAAEFTSPSFRAMGIGNFTPHISPITDVLPMFKDEVSSAFSIPNPDTMLGEIFGSFGLPDVISRAIGSLNIPGIFVQLLLPNVYYIMPKFSTLQFLQMSLGQYAYVWYNSTAQVPENDLIKFTKSYADMTPAQQKEYKEQQKEYKAVTDDQLSFDRQVFTQTQDNSDPFSLDGTWGIFATILLALAGAAIDYGSSKLNDFVINKIQGHQSSGANTDDRSFGQMFLENVMNISFTDTGYTGRLVCLTNTITALKTLDMFYSTGDNIQCYAGPGHVSHSLQAQCVSQSILSTRSNGYVMGMFAFCPTLTLLELRLRKFLWDWLKDFADAHIRGITGAAAGELAAGSGVIHSGSLDPQTTPQLILWYPLYYVGKYMYAVSEWIEENAVRILDGLCPGPKFIPYGKVDKNDMVVEGKHNYGTKSMTFMYPCFGCGSEPYTNEWVNTYVDKRETSINMDVGDDPTMLIPLAGGFYDTTTDRSNASLVAALTGKLHMNVVKSVGGNSRVTTPVGMAVVEGCSSFLPTVPFKNERIGVSQPVFGFPPIQDYILDSRWDLGMTCTAGSINAVSVKDTKLIDGRYSNCYITNNFCGIACSYGAFEVKRGIHYDYLRPYAVTPNMLAINVTGINVFSRNIAYHGFDGYSTRIVRWNGGVGTDKERRNFLYTFLADGNIKMSNNYPANVYFGYFKGASPVQAIPARRGLTNYVYNSRDMEGMNSVVNNEYRAMERYSIPVFTEMIGVLPVVVRTYGSFVLKRFSGVTSLCTELRETDDGVYKMEAECDFAIRNNTYRVTPEYINSTTILDSRTDVKAVCAKLGLQYIGSDQGNGYFYNQSTHQYYVFNGGELRSVDVWNRFKNITRALYDFLSQDVAFVCDASMDVLDVSPYKADNELMINLFNSTGVHRNVYPPIETIMSEDSGFRLLTLPGGVTYQGPNRCIINRSIWQDYMTDDVNRNKKQWLRMPRENYHPWRKYPDHYEVVNKKVECNVKGWTHNPFVFVTSTIGTAEDTDCIYEWEIVFAWTPEMDKIFTQREYVCVSVAAKTFCPGGIVAERPTHIFLTRELFTHSDNAGYYSFLYRSNGGAGNKEQLFIWADSYIALSSLWLHYKPITQKRTSKLTIQQDVHGMIEM